MNSLQKFSRLWLEKIFSGDRLKQREVVRVLPQDAIRAIDCPRMETPPEACTLAAREKVIGVVVGGESRAYPLSILSVHEVVNDIIGGVPVAVTWCPLSYSAVVYKRSVEERTLEFGVSGGILRNVTVLFDRQTGTCWNQLRGDGFAGPLSGFQLELLPSVITQWQVWAASYPLTLVLSKKNNAFGHYEDDHMRDYYVSNRTGIRPPVDTDSRLQLKEIVFGVGHRSDYRVYPFSLLEKAKLLHDRIYGDPITVFYEPDTGTAIAYRTSDGNASHSFFEQEGSYYDSATGSRWSVLCGTAVEGPLMGSSLQPVISRTAFWFAWADHFPGSEIYTLPVIH